MNLQSGHKILFSRSFAILRKPIYVRSYLLNIKMFNPIVLLLFPGVILSSIFARPIGIICKYFVAFLQLKERERGRKVVDAKEM